MNCRYEVVEERDDETGAVRGWAVVDPEGFEADFFRADRPAALAEAEGYAAGKTAEARLELERELVAERLEAFRRGVWRWDGERLGRLTAALDLVAG